MFQQKAEIIARPRSQQKIADRKHRKQKKQTPVVVVANEMSKVRQERRACILSNSIGRRGEVGSLRLPVIVVFPGCPRHRWVPPGSRSTSDDCQPICGYPGNRCQFEIRYSTKTVQYPEVCRKKKTEEPNREPKQGEPKKLERENREEAELARLSFQLQFLRHVPGDIKASLSHSVNSCHQKKVVGQPREK